MNSESKNTVLWILVYTLVIIPIIWIWLGIGGMGDAGNAFRRVTEQNSLLRIIALPFEILFCLGFWGGLGLAMLLLLIGCFGITKKWAKYICLFGMWIVILYFTGSAVVYIISFLADCANLWAWFLLQILPVLLITGFFTYRIFRRIRKIETL